MHSSIRTLVAISLLAVLGCEPAADVEQASAADVSATPSDPLVWSGHGVMFGPDGSEQGTYSVDLSREPTATGYRQVVKIGLPNGQTRVFEQALEVAADGSFRISSEAGTGGGYDLGDGFITMYQDTDEGSFASSIFSDGDRMRILRYQLVDGAPVHIFRETLFAQ